MKNDSMESRKARTWTGRWALVVAGFALSLSVFASDGKGHDAAAVVEAREIAFARTMADRDLDAFLTFVSPEAVFFGREGPLRGRDAIAKGWGPFFAGETPPFSWHPDSVEVLDSGHLAFSSGPVINAAGEQVGRFNSIWRKDPDGQWRVVFDKGS